MCINWKENIDIDIYPKCIPHLPPPHWPKWTPIHSISMYKMGVRVCPYWKFGWGGGEGGDGETGGGGWTRAPHFSLYPWYIEEHKTSISFYYKQGKIPSKLKDFTLCEKYNVFLKKLPSSWFSLCVHKYIFSEDIIVHIINEKLLNHTKS